MPRPATRHANARSTPMAPSFSTASSAAADDFRGLSLASGSSPLSSRHSSASPTPAPRTTSSGHASTHVRGNSTASHSGPKRKERQTRLQEHLRTVKPGSTSTPGPKPRSSFANSTGSKTLPSRAVPELSSVELSPTSSRPKRKAAQKVVMQEVEDESDQDSLQYDDALAGDESEDAQASEGEGSAPSWRRSAARRSRGDKAPRAVPREREISSLSTVSAGIDVEGMDEDEVQNRLAQEKHELMERLAQHGINPQADVLDRALVTLSSSNEKLTVESFLRALSSLDSRSPSTNLLPLPLSTSAPTLTVQASNGNQAKRVSFGALESPSTPTSSHSSLYPSPPTKPVTLPGSVPLIQNPLGPVLASNAVASSSNILPVPPNSATFAGPPVAAAVPAPSSLFGNSLPGMGRIALTRRHTYLGVPSASDPVPTLLPAFEPVRQPASERPSSLSSPVRPAPVTGSSVSKLQSWLDDDDSEDEDIPVEPAKGRPDERNGQDAPLAKKAAVNEDAEMEIRVGGKTVKVLRKRRHDDNGDDEDTDPTVAAPTLSPKRKGKQRAVECVCGETISVDEPSHGSVSCGACETLFHLACLKVHSRRHLPLEWHCERCRKTAPTKPKDSLETPPKRPRTGPEMTPPMSSEPTFVTGSFSPIPRGNFAACPDVALAPSPTSSPKRSFAAVPTSPNVSAQSKVTIPATPHFGKDADPRSDYSPCSPLFNRKSRSRLVSGVFDSAPFGNDWAADPALGGGVGVGGVGVGVGAGGNPFDVHAAFGDSLNAHDWHDVTMTPSRGLGPSGASGVSAGWETPFASRSRQPSTVHSQSALAHLRTPSQDLFSGSALDYVQGGRHTAPAQMFAQRLFGAGAGGGGGGGGGEDPLSSPSSSLSRASTKRASRHGRNPSSSYILPPHAFTSPSSAPFSSSLATNSVFSQLPPTPQSGSNYLRPSSWTTTTTHSTFPPSPSRMPSGAVGGLASSAMKSSVSAPGMLRTGSDGLGIGYDHHHHHHANVHNGDEDNDGKNSVSSSHFDDLLL